MNFGEAIEALKEGEMVQREGWNETYNKPWWIRLEVPHEESYMTLPYIYMSTAQGDFVPWLPSHNDMLSDDWSVLSCAVQENGAPRLLRPPIKNTAVPSTSGKLTLK